MFGKALLFILLAALAITSQAAEYEGSLQWYKQRPLSLSEAGVINKVYVKPGQRVKKNGKLLSLDERPFNARLAQHRAQTKRLELLLGEATREFERAQDLYDRTLLSDHDLELARIAHAESESQYLAAKAQLRQANLQKEFGTLKALEDILVLEVPAYPGQVINQSTAPVPLVIVADDKHMQVHIVVNHDTLTTLKQGQACQVKVNGKLLDGVIDDMAMSADKNGLFPVRVRFARMQGSPLRAGPEARVVLP